MEAKHRKLQYHTWYQIHVMNTSISQWQYFVYTH